MSSYVLRLAPFLINILVVVGFFWQVSLICRDYFKYPTTTIVTIVNALEKNNAPQVAFCSSWDNSWRKIGNQNITQRFHEQLMDQPPDGSFPGGNPKPTRTTIPLSRIPPKIRRQKNITGRVDEFE